MKKFLYISLFVIALFGMSHVYADQYSDDYITLSSAQKYQTIADQYLADKDYIKALSNYDLELQYLSQIKSDILKNNVATMKALAVKLMDNTLLKLVEEYGNLASKNINEEKYNDALVNTENALKYIGLITNKTQDITDIEQTLLNQKNQLNQIISKTTDIAIDLLKTISDPNLQQNNLNSAISLLNKYGVTKFDNANDFMANNAIRRDEAAKMYLIFAKSSNTFLDKIKLNMKDSSLCQFKDTKNAWSDIQPMISEACQYNLFQGYNGLFNPLDKITNGQAVVVLMRMLIGPMDEKNVTHYAENYMKEAAEYRLLLGLGISMDNVDEYATRGNIAQLLYRADSWK